MCRYDLVKDEISFQDVVVRLETKHETYYYISTMAQSSSTDIRIKTAISLEICPVRLVNSTEKSYKESITKEIIIIVNALMNSGGGTLEMIYKSTPLRKQIDDSVRIIEQKVGDLIGTVGLVSSIEFQVLPGKIFLNVKEVEGPFVVNYNLYLPTKSQVKVIQPSEPIAKVKAVINRVDKPIKETLTPGAYYQHFVLNEKVSCDEGTKIQWKSLKSESTKNVSLADRMTGKSNKLSCYISAFSNHSGGHIYYGINDDGIVEGEVVTEKHQTEIARKVAKTFEKIIWPRHCSGKQLKGKLWDLFFVPVKDSKKTPIASSFVIVVAIAPCRGGVFTDKPESYHIVDGKVERMNLADVQNYFDDTLEAPLELGPASKMKRLLWSSKKNRHIYQALTTKLVQFRNDKKAVEFKKLCHLAVSKYPSSCARLVSTAEKGAIACKNNEFKTAKLLLSDFMETLNQSMVNDVSFFEVRGLCLKSRIERAEGKFEESYNTVKDGLQKMQLVPADFLTVWFYINAAAVANILCSKEENPQRYANLVEESQTYLQSALRDSNTLDENQYPRSTSDLKQKTRIYLAMSILGCSLTGEVAKQKHRTKADIVNAASQLKAVQESKIDGIQPTRFQEVEYFLAQSDLCYCRAMLSSNSADQTTDLKWASELSTKAQCLAQELQFEEAVCYAQRRLARLTEILDRNAVQSSSKRRLEQDLEDLLDFHKKGKSEEN